jgi:hypothetical protein
MMFLVKLRDFPSLGGSFVSMFLQVLITFLKVVLVLILFVLCFAFVFVAMLRNAESFQQPLDAFLKTFFMFLGDLDFENLYKIIKTQQSEDRLVTIIFFVTFCVCMPIIIMNLLVGLAVEDVGQIRKIAKITELTSKLETILEWEYTLPNRLGKKLDLLSGRTRIAYPKNFRYLSEHTLNSLCKLKEFMFIPTTLFGITL